MSELLRCLVMAPAATFMAVWEWATHDGFQTFIDGQTKRFNDMAKGD